MSSKVSLVLLLLSLLVLVAAAQTLAQDTTLSVNASSTAQQRMVTETAARSTLLALSWTPTPRPTSTPLPPTATFTPSPTDTPDLLTVARSFSGSNADWTPVVQAFDGVPMVLVPAGCFMMGSNAGNTDELPVHEQCFAEPFWIDQTEVTQADFARLGGTAAQASIFSGGQRPVEQITWFEARAFCERRGGRLPTEAEWEYAARGPDGLIYPWGNDWDAALAVWERLADQGTAAVGSIPEGRSWVGAFDMSGNVWEWVSSLYLPYDSTDDREADMGNQTDVLRVLRGGSWRSDVTDLLRAAYRSWYFPGGGYYYLGFRCARST